MGDGRPVQPVDSVRFRASERMTKEQITKAAHRHDDQIRAHCGDNTPLPAPDPWAAGGTGRIAHLRWMLLSILAFVAEDRLDKANRWLGFVQGALWYLGISSIEESKQINKPSN